MLGIDKLAGIQVGPSGSLLNLNYSYDNNGNITRSSYDGSGMRVKKNEGGKTLYFMYNGNDQILEYSATDAKYTYYIYAGKQSIAEETNGVVKFYHKDHLGSTRVATDASGNIAASYTYEPFGKVTSGGDGEQRFTGFDFGLRNLCHYIRGGLLYHIHRYFLFRSPTHSVGLNPELIISNSIKIVKINGACLIKI
jgi:hypothetical protein